MRHRYLAPCLLALACGRTALRDGFEDAGAGAAAGGGAGGSQRGGGTGAGGALGSGGRTPLPSGGTSGHGAATGDAGSAQGGALPEDRSGTVLRFHELSGNCSPRVRDVVRAPNGDVALAGNYCETLTLDGGPPVLDMSDGFDGFVLVIDAQSRPRWARHFDGMFGESVVAVAFLPNGHLFAQGRAADRTTFAAELDAQGKELWTSHTAAVEEVLPGDALFAADFGRTDVGGVRPILDTFPPWGPWQAYVRRRDQSGEEVSQHRFTLYGWEQAVASHVAPAGGGGIVLAGWGIAGERRPAFVRTASAAGAELFTTRVETTASVELVGLAVADGGAVVVGGGFQGKLTIGSTELPSPPAGSSGEWLAKLDRRGKPLWLKGNEPGSKLSSLDVDEAGHIVVAGVNDRGLFVRRLSPDGERVWSREFAATKVSDLRVIAAGAEQVLLVGDAAGVVFGPSWVTREGSPFLVTLAQRK